MRAAAGGEADGARSHSDGERKRAAIELFSRHEATLRRTARRYSICTEDAEDALQRALEILLTKAPTTDQRQLIRWMQTVTKHEALAVRRQRERILSKPRPASQDSSLEQDWISLIPSQSDGPADLAERRERVARTREALSILKPHELRALTLLAEGYSYAEIGELTGWTYTKINRCLAEGRARFRAFLTRSESGERCDELHMMLSAFCDGEVSATEAATVREHLHACPHCRAKLRAFRAAPRAAAALLPVLPVSRSLLDRANEFLLGLQLRASGRTGASDSAISQIAASGGTRGSGLAMMAKIVTACVGTAGGAAACVAGGVVPSPADIFDGDRKPAHERIVQAEQDPAPALAPPNPELVEPPPPPPVAEQPSQPIPAPPAPKPESAPQPQPEPEPEPEPEPAPPESVEFTPESTFTAGPSAAPASSAPAPAPSSGSGSSSGASEFGP